MDNFSPTFKGELQFRRYSDTSTQGQQVVFAVADREALECFIGKEGKRFAAMLVELGDDEQPVDTRNSGDVQKVEKSHLNREPLGDLCWRAVQWCKEPEFWKFLEWAYGGEITSEQAAKHELENLLGIASRKELDTNAEAEQKFHSLIRSPYQKYLIARGVVR